VNKRTAKITTSEIALVVGILAMAIPDSTIGYFSNTSASCFWLWLTSGDVVA